MGDGNGRPWLEIFRGSCEIEVDEE